MPMEGSVPNSRGGFTLIETLLVVVVLGMLLAIVAPRIGDAMVRRDVRNTRVALVSLYQQARLVAIQRGQPAALRFDADSAWITVGVGGAATQLGPGRDMNTLYGTSVTASDPAITVTPTGLFPNTASTYTVTFAKRGVRDSLVVNGYGRIQ